LATTGNKQYDNKTGKHIFTIQYEEHKHEETNTPNGDSKDILKECQWQAWNANSLKITAKETHL
jgi:hypothetical protein